MMGNDPHYFHKEYPKTLREDDFWGQVRRTVNGQPVGEEQIGMIVDAVTAGLDLVPQDTLLDICCGNGALTDRIFAHCKGGTGVDFSEYLVGIAQKYFEKKPNRSYVAKDAEEFLRAATETGQYTKALIYGAFSCFARDKARTTLQLLRERFPNVGVVYIGNLPDKNRMQAYFETREYIPGMENDPNSQIGIWYTEAEFVALGKETGWSVQVHHMPVDFFGAKFRFDMVLRPASVRS